METVTRIKIGPLTIPVEFHECLMDGETQLHGQMDWLEYKIKLSNHNPDIYQFVTLWHEVLHALENVYGIRLSERQVEALATLIVQVLQDNEQLRVPPG